MSDGADDLGPVYTKGTSFRARAEARQREYRARVLRVGWADHGHWLDPAAARAGRNFITAEAHEAALRRAAAGKGVAWQRTFSNMLASQAMCFNLFAPLARDLALAGRVLTPFFDGLSAVRGISIEYTPAASTFRDQSALGGVDCDVLIDAERSDRTRALITLETKFVEEEFSICGFRKAGRRSKGQVVCPPDVPVRGNRRACLYGSRKGYAYWEQTDRLRTLRDDALPDAGCPFGGPEWQLWVNHTLAHAEADSRGAARALFVVCAPAANDILLSDGILDRFRARLRHPETFAFLSLEALVGRIGQVAAEDVEAHLKPWADGLSVRYSGI